MKYQRSREEIIALSTLLIRINTFSLPVGRYKVIKKEIDRLIDTLEYTMALLELAANDEQIYYNDSPEIYQWLMKEHCPVLDKWESEIEKISKKIE